MNEIGHNRLATLATEINRADAAFRHHARFTLQAAMEAGNALIEAKALLAHGEWQTWLRANCAMSARTARRYMQLASANLKTDTVAALSLRGALAEITEHAETAKLYRECQMALSDYAGGGFERVMSSITDPVEALWFLWSVQAEQSPAMLAFLFIAQEMKNQGQIDNNPVLRSALLQNIAAPP